MHNYHSAAQLYLNLQLQEMTFFDGGSSFARALPSWMAGPSDTQHRGSTFPMPTWAKIYADGKKRAKEKKSLH